MLSPFLPLPPPKEHHPPVPAPPPPPQTLCPDLLSQDPLCCLPLQYDHPLPPPQVPTAAQRLWTSPQPMSERHDFGLHAIINSAIREDDPEEAPAAAVISRALNSLLVFRRPPVELHFPPGATVWRGGGLPDAHRAFYTAGKMYRVPGFLATSFSEDKAYEFMYRAHALHGLPAVQWVVHLDPRGQQQFRYRCKQVNFVNATQVPGEEEFLFAAYSVFTVRDVQWVSEATPDGPHVVHLEAAIDNNLPNSGGLPLAPWY